MALRWASLPQNVSRGYRAKRLSIVRCFARYLAARDGRTEVPDRHLVPRAYFRPQPHLYSQREIEQLLAATGRLWPTYPLKRLLYQTLFGLLACTGLRVSEALKLNAADVDLEHGVLRIEMTKFKKSRLVPLHPTATRALRRYAELRYGQWSGNDDRPLFVNSHGNRLVAYSFSNVV
jgi:site-specific recombinase XerD